ncbi:hypothetical protein GW746_01285 [Candidatus Saccharibacteria bacterium]|nr:hypothetical protein [Candidatus Saccharibacteria bacterium]NCS83032.1 hypothetical protein [Candidatus Saccharibacteria bacterium]
MSKKKLLLIIAIVIGLGVGGYFAYGYFFSTDGASEDTNGSTFAPCDDRFVTLYAESVYESKDTASYAEEVAGHAKTARNIPDYNNDINCVFISYEDYVYANNAVKARSEFEKFKSLYGQDKTVNSLITSFMSIDSMEQIVKNLEHNNALEESGEEIDGRG